MDVLFCTCIIPSSPTTGTSTKDPRLAFGELESVLQVSSRDTPYPIAVEHQGNMTCSILLALFIQVRTVARRSCVTAVRVTYPKRMNVA